MFVMVRYGANCQEMVKVQCCVLILTAHLRRKRQCRPEDCIDLLDETGTLMNLSKVENPASEFASKYLQERECYILRVIPKLLIETAQFSLCARKGRESSEATCYESFLENLGNHCPEPAGEHRAPQIRPGTAQDIIYHQEFRS
ncbi:unnamed protein product [Bubo scandiacus]